jgi:GNAT superfamily N-acetyltransferase
MREDKMNITYKNNISAEQFNMLRVSAGWKVIHPDLAQKGLDNTAYIIVACENGLPIGMARVVTDYGYTVIIADVIVLPAYQRKGIGKEIMTRIMTYIKENISPGQAKFINLMSAKGKEGFYKKFGFEERPNDKNGCGMTQWIEK